MKLSGNHVNLKYKRLKAVRKMNAGDSVILSSDPWYGEDSCGSQESLPLKLLSFTLSWAVFWCGLSQIISSWVWLLAWVVLIILNAVPPEILWICRTKAEGSCCGCGLQDMQDMWYVLIKYCIKEQTWTLKLLNMERAAWCSPMCLDGLTNVLSLPLLVME